MTTQQRPISRVIDGLLSQSTGISFSPKDMAKITLVSDNVVDLWNHDSKWNEDTPKIKNKAMDLLAVNQKLSLPRESLIPFFRKLRLDGNLISQIDRFFLCFTRLTYVSLNSCGLTEIANMDGRV